MNKPTVKSDPPMSIKSQALYLLTFSLADLIQPGDTTDQAAQKKARKKKKKKSSTTTSSATFWARARAIRVALSLSSVESLARSYHNIIEDDLEEGEDTMDLNAAGQESREIVCAASRAMLVVFECVISLATFERLRLPQMYDLMYEQLYGAANDLTEEGSMIGMVGGMWKDVVSGRGAAGRGESARACVRLMAGLMLDEEKR